MTLILRKKSIPVSSKKIEKAQKHAHLRDLCFWSCFSPHERNCTTFGISALCAFWRQNYETMSTELGKEWKDLFGRALQIQFLVLKDRTNENTTSSEEYYLERFVALSCPFINDMFRCSTHQVARSMTSEFSNVSKGSGWQLAAFAKSKKTASLAFTQGKSRTWHAAVPHWVGWRPASPSALFPNLGPWEVIFGALI